MPDEFGRFFEFPPFRFDLADKVLTLEGRPVPLPARAAEILGHLIQNQDRLVPRNELREKFWSELYVADNTIDRQISEIRRALRTQPGAELHIETQSKKGWRFVAHLGTTLPPSQADETVAEAAVRPRWKGFWITGAIAALAMLVCALALRVFSEKRPTIAKLAQLTYDGRSKDGPLRTDGRHLFFLETIAGSHRVVEMPMYGGEPVELNIELPQLNLEDISWDGSKLLLHSEAPPDGSSLWTYDLKNRSVRKLRAGFTTGSWGPDGTLSALQAPAIQGDKSSLITFGSQGTVKMDVAGSIEDLAWAPDGTKILFSLLNAKQDSESEWVADRRGVSRRISMLTNGSAFVRQGSWSRNGRYLVYSAGDGLQHDIWVAGDKPYNLTKGGPGSWSWPVFSYDSSTIFAIQRSVRPELVRLDGNTNHWQTEWQGAAAFELDYSRDGSWVVYTRFPDHTLWKSRRDGTGRSQLTDAQLEAHQAHWSPDGTRIAFMAKNAKGQWRIWQVAANGGKPEQLLENGEDQGTPTWSADGSKLIFGDFLGRRPGAEMCIHQLDLKKRKVSDVPGSKGLWSPRWSPNGLWVAAITSESRALGVLPLGKTAFVKLAQMLFVDNATWSADSRYIYFNGISAQGGKGLFRVSVPQGRLERLADLTDFEVPPENWYGVTPEGAPLAFRAVNVQEIFALKCELP